MIKTTVFSLLFLVFSLAGTAWSDIFRYTDESGVVCYTDAPFGKKTELVLRENRPEEKQSLSLKQPIARADYSHYVQKAATKYDIDSALINAVIKTESNGNHKAISRKGAIGLMQLMPTTASDMNVRNPYNPEENIEGGTRYLRAMLEKFNGDLTLALAAYNAGPGTVEKYRSVPPISETRDYVKKVYSLYKGKQNYTTSGMPSKNEPPPQAKQAPIYKVTLDDGTILFTNATIAKTTKLRF
ncbi:MAG: lytic transglycosylase [Thermodesulfovibrio sp.]|nr:lytic transglycosylase [Thermodesulfovibrio sp.]